MSEKGNGEALSRTGVSVAHTGVLVPWGARDAAMVLPGQIVAHKMTKTLFFVFQPIHWEYICGERDCGQIAEGL